jgi:5-methyltetrahydropteroyltriglutamate--homocysteine methyltransferase
VELAQEDRLDADIKVWLAFATEKLTEVAALARGLDEGEAAIEVQLANSDRAVLSRTTSTRVHRQEVTDRVASVTPDMEQRASPYKQRRTSQFVRLKLPPFPTTTIGSFPQTTEVRHLRAALGRGEIERDDHDRTIEEWIADAVRWQEEIGLDVLVHGEFERNDMVKYFAEHLEGFAFTKHGWVQSYGSRCVAPPIIWGDVSRPAPMTVRWASYAQSLTARPMKGMLTGPVTMLQWSFVRDDLPREAVCRQIALAIRDEVADLEVAGIAVIQVDEPAFREGLPLRRADWPAYLGWAVSASGWQRRWYATTPPSTRICAIRNSTTSCRRSVPWTRTRFRSRPPVAGWNYWTPSRSSARHTRPRLAQASGTFTAHAFPMQTR